MFDADTILVFDDEWRADWYAETHPDGARFSASPAVHEAYDAALLLVPCACEDTSDRTVLHTQYICEPDHWAEIGGEG